MKRKKKLGRPPHAVDDERVHTVEVLAGMRLSADRIAKALEIDDATLLKHYGRVIERAPAKIEAQLIGNLFRLMRGDGAVALNATRLLLEARFGWSVFAPPPKPREARPAAPPEEKPRVAEPVVEEVEEKLGKKERANLEAQTAHEGTTWGEILN